MTNNVRTLAQAVRRSAQRATPIHQALPMDRKDEKWLIDWGFADWGLPGQHLILSGKDVVATIPFTQPYVMGATKEEKDAANKAKERTVLIRASQELYDNLNKLYNLIMEKDPQLLIDDEEGHFLRLDIEKLLLEIDVTAVKAKGAS